MGTQSAVITAQKCDVEEEYDASAVVSALGNDTTRLLCTCSNHVIFSLCGIRLLLAFTSRRSSPTWAPTFKPAKSPMLVPPILVVVYATTFAGHDHAGVIKSSVDEIGEFAADNVISSPYSLKHILWIVRGVLFHGFKQVLHILR